jgi:hypothetical protein
LSYILGDIDWLLSLPLNTDWLVYLGKFSKFL